MDEGRSPRAILLVDDNPAVRSALATMLRHLGYRVLEAGSASDALAAVRRERIDGFLLDIDLSGGVDGIELCRRVRARDEHRVSPILFITGGDEYSHLDPVLEAGGDDFIPKPFVAALVEARLRRHLQRTQYFAELQETRLLLGRYVSDATTRVVESSVSMGRPLEPEVRHVSICFTDIRGFTALSEDMDPLTLFSVLNRHLSEQVRSVHRHHGYIDKFGGDGLMAVFEGPDRELESCLCALDVIEKAQRQGSSWSDRIHQLGIGIHTGRAIVGNLGPSERLEYTAIGTTVNLAARLCGVAEPLSIVVSSDVRAAVGEDPRLRFHSGRQVAIRGLKNPVTVYTLDAA